jgi:hypothetical protein
MKAVVEDSPQTRSSQEPPTIVRISEETTVEIVNRANEPTPTPIIRIEAASGEHPPPLPSFSEYDEELIERTNEGSAEPRQAYVEYVPNSDDGEPPANDIQAMAAPTPVAGTVGPLLKRETSTTFTCTLDGKKRRRRRLFLCRVRNLAMRKHLLYLFIGKGLAEQAKPVLQQLAKGECAIVGDLEVHVHS